MSRTLTDPSAGSTLNHTLPIYNGGTDEITGPDALLALNGVPASDYNQPNGILGLNSLGYIPDAQLPDSIASTIGIMGPELLQINGKAEWLITNYDQQITYVITASAGTISRNEDIIYFTAPSTPQDVTISVNNKSFIITIDDIYINKPTISTPTQDALLPNSGSKVISSELDIVGYVTKKSLRFRGVNSYLSKTPAIAGNRQKWTFSAWVKRVPNTHQVLFSARDYNNSTNNYPYGSIEFTSTNQLQYGESYNGVYIGQKITNDTFNNPNKWIHVVVTLDTTLSTASDRVKLYVDGVRLTSFATSIDPSAYSSYINNTVLHTLGSNISANPFVINIFLNGYLADIHFIDGQALEPTAFGEDNVDFGRWMPKEYTGTYGQNGYYLDFSNNATVNTLCLDQSGNMNHWTPNNISISGNTKDDYDDSVYKNYAILDVSNKGTNAVLYDGGLRIGATSAGAIGHAKTTLALTGKRYCEMIPTLAPGGSSFIIGLCNTNDINSIGSTNIGLLYYNWNGGLYLNAVLIASIATLVTNDVVGLAYDKDTDVAIVYKNGVQQWTGVLGFGTDVYFLAGDGSSNAVEVTCNFGQRPFTYTPPAGYIGLYTPEEHASTDWELSDVPGFETTLSQSLADTANLTTWVISSLELDKDYYIRNKYNSLHYGSSEWSDIQHIKTRASFLPTNEVGFLTASDKASNDQYGMSVALSGDGTRLAVGAWNKTLSGVSNTGQVYIYVKTNGTWTEEAKLNLTTKAVNDYFGASVALDYTGSRLAVGASGQAASGTTGAGQVHHYTRSGSVWTFESVLFASDRAVSDNFGTSVSLNADGTMLAVGAYFKDVTVADAGKVYIYTRSGSVWTQHSTLTAADKAASDEFGRSVSLSSDGSRLAVGAYAKDVTVADAGKVYIYTRNDTVWTEETTLTASDKVASDLYGCSVSFNDDASILAVGAYLKDISGITDAGQVYFYKRLGITWTEENRLTASDKAASNRFGISVSLTSNGSELATGATNKTINGVAGAGQVYLFN